MPEKMRSAVDKTLSEAADELVEQMRVAVPVDQGELRDSIQKKPIEDTLGVGRMGYRVVAGERGKGKKAWYVRFVEFGTSTGSPAQPFFFPTYRRLKRRIRSRLTRALRRAAKEA